MGRGGTGLCSGEGGKQCRKNASRSKSHPGREKFMSEKKRVWEPWNNICVWVTIAGNGEWTATKGLPHTRKGELGDGH